MTRESSLGEVDGGETEADTQSESDTASVESTEEEIGILDVREQVADIADTLVGQPFDGITTVEASTDGGWRAVFEVVERSAVPDTQDIIGRYELILSATGDVQEYSLQQRFKRSEMQGETL